MPLTPTQQASLERLRALGSSVVSDALRDLGHPDHIAEHGLRPANRRHACAGPIRVALFAPVGDDRGDFRPLARFIDAVEPGEVLVLAGSAEAAPASLWGEICSAAAEAHGAAGVVIDGFMRDELAIEAGELPLFSRGAYARDYLGRAVIVGIDTPAVVGGVAVQPGDIVVADIDGVVFFDPGLIEAVLVEGERKAAAEASLIEAVRGGGSLHDAVSRVGTL